MTLYALIVITIASAAGCYWLAARRGGDGPFWLIMGVLFGPFALPFACFARRKKAH